MDRIFTPVFRPLRHRRPRTVTRQTALLVGILLLAFALRMVRIGELRMWGDEAFSVYSANRGLAAITSEGAENDPHPPFYYYLLHFYMPLAGASELALRLFSVLPGVATVAVVYGMGRRLYNRRVGMAASLIAALAPFDVYYSQEIRMYALAILLSALGTYFLIRLFQTSPPQDARRLWLAYAIVMLLDLYTLYPVAFVVLAHAILVLTQFKTKRAFFWRWFALAAGLGLAFAPWLLMRFTSTIGHLEDRAGSAIQSLPVFLARGFGWLTVGATVPAGLAFWPAALFLSVIIAGLLVAWSRHALNARDGWLVALVVVPMLAVYPLYLLLPILIARLFALAFVPLAILLARSLSLLDRRIVAALALVLGSVVAYSLEDYYVRYDRYNPAAEDYIPVIQTVEQNARPGDVVLFHAFWQIGYFLSHYRGPSVEYRALADLNDLADAVARPRQVWAVVQNLSLHGSEVWLAQHAFPVSEKKFGQMRLVEFRAGVPGQGQRFTSPLVFNNGIRLLGYNLNDAPLTPGQDRLMVQLDWQATEAISADYTVSIRLTNPNDWRPSITWAQEDSQPAAGTRPMSQWQPSVMVEDRHTLDVPLGTPPGQYAVRAVIYNAASGAASSVVEPEDRRGQEIYLGDVTIARPATIAPVSRTASRVSVQWDDMALVGYEAGADQLTPGDQLPLTFYWKVQTRPRENYIAVIQVVDAAGNAHAPQTFRIGTENFGSAAWRPGEVWTDKVLVKIDADTAPGRATVLVGLYGGLATPVSTQDPNLRWSNVSLPPSEGKPVTMPAVELTYVELKSREHHFELPKPNYPTVANWDEKIKLLGYDLTLSTFNPGDQMNLTLYWQAQRLMDARYAVFIHVVNAAGDLVAQSDGEPQSGNAPTTGWLPSEIIQDPYTIELPGNLPAGEYSFQVGLYQPATGARLRIAGAPDDSLEIGRIRIP